MRRSRLDCSTGFLTNSIPFMPKRRPVSLSIGTKLTILLVLLMVAMLALVLVNINLFGRHIEGVVQNHAVRVSEVVARALQESSGNHLDYVRGVVDNIGLEAEIDAIRIYDPRGRIWISTDRAEEGTVLDVGAPQCIRCHSTEPPLASLPLQDRVRRFRVADGSRVLALTHPIENLPGCTASDCHSRTPGRQVRGVVEVERSLKQADVRTRETRATVLAVSAILILLTGLLFRGFVNRVIQRPIAGLIEGTERISAMDLEHRIPESSDDELGHLSQSFNLMTEKLKTEREANRRWSETLEERVREKSQELEQAQAHLMLVDKMASLGKLAGVVAHEINNPLAGILTYAKLSIRNLSGQPAGKEITDSIENLMVISDEAKRCGHIVNSLLNFSKRTYGQMSEVDVLPLAERSIELARHSTRTTEIELRLDNLCEDTRLYCDPAAIEQMLLVFMMNAVEAMPRDEGMVTLRLRDHPNRPSIIVEFEDTGSGISEEDLAHVFEPYFTTKASGRNTGLGLAVAYKIIVDQHGGRVSVSSVVGQGTIFTIELPRREPNEVESQTETQGTS